MIRTARLLLRPARPEDLEDLHAVYGDARAMRYWSTPPHQELETTRIWLDGLIAGATASPFYYVFEHGGRAIGTGGIHEGDEIGFILHPDVWRRGFAREAVGAIIGHVFAATALDRITADVDPRNSASIACLKSMGFRKIGEARNTFFIAGAWCDSLYFAVFRSDRENSRT